VEGRFKVMVTISEHGIPNKKGIRSKFITYRQYWYCNNCDTTQFTDFWVGSAPTVISRCPVCDILYLVTVSIGIPPASNSYMETEATRDKRYRT
jgi:hypothetical protein